MVAAMTAEQRERQRASARARYVPARERARNLKRRYGTTTEEVAALMARQNGLCLGCGEEPATCVDHDHETGEIRGALCRLCNLQDKLGVNSRTDPDLTAEESDQLAALIDRALDIPVRLVGSSRNAVEPNLSEKAVAGSTEAGVASEPSEATAAVSVALSRILGAPQELRLSSGGTG